VAHNPRIRIAADAAQPLAALIRFVTNKWKPRSVQLAEALADVIDFLFDYPILFGLC